MALEQHDPVLSELNKISRLIALLVTQEDKSQKDKILRLSSAGLKPKEIADLIDTTPNAVSVTLHSAKKGEERSRGKPS